MILRILNESVFELDLNLIKTGEQTRRVTFKPLSIFFEKIWLQRFLMTK